MLHKFSEIEIELLSLAVPALGLPAMVAPDIVDLHERAWKLEYPDEVCPRGEENLEAYMKILGALTSTYEERLQLIRTREGS